MTELVTNSALAQTRVSPLGTTLIVDPYFPIPAPVTGTWIAALEVCSLRSDDTCDFVPRLYPAPARRVPYNSSLVGDQGEVPDINFWIIPFLEQDRITQLFADITQPALDLLDRRGNREDAVCEISQLCRYYHQYCIPQYCQRYHQTTQEWLKDHGVGA